MLTRDRPQGDRGKPHVRPVCNPFYEQGQQPPNALRLSEPESVGACFCFPGLSCTLVAMRNVTVDAVTHAQGTGVAFSFLLLHLPSILAFVQWKHSFTVFPPPSLLITLVFASPPDSLSLSLSFSNTPTQTVISALILWLSLLVSQCL